MVYHLAKKEAEKASLDMLNMTNFPLDIDKDSFVKEMSNIINVYLYQNLKDIKIKELFNDIISIVSKHNIAFRSR